MLPQTGIGLPTASAVLSGFPRLLADYTAQMGLLWMWDAEFKRLLGPTAGTSTFLAQPTVGAATSPQATDPFREVVLRVWLASNSPDALPDKMQPVETSEAIYTRVRAAQLVHWLAGGDGCIFRWLCVPTRRSSLITS